MESRGEGGPGRNLAGTQLKSTSSLEKQSSSSALLLRGAPELSSPASQGPRGVPLSSRPAPELGFGMGPIC